jgi:hypothetical protein
LSSIRVSPSHQAWRYRPRIDCERPIVKANRCFSQGEGISQPLKLARAVAVGQKLRVEFLYAIEPGCSSMGVTRVQILEPPQHGKLTVENGQAFTSFAKENQRYGCDMQKSPGTFVFYEPAPGFAGKDSITLGIIFSDRSVLDTALCDRYPVTAEPGARVHQGWAMVQ